MMLTEILQSRRGKLIFLTVFVLIPAIICIVYNFKPIQPFAEYRSEYNEARYSDVEFRNAEYSVAAFNIEPNSPEVLIHVSGKWKITDYLGESVEFSGVNKSEEQESEHDNYVKETINRYLGKTLKIDVEQDIKIRPPTEVGYYYDDWRELFNTYRQPHNIWDGTAPPFLCVSIELSGFDDRISMIKDANGIMTLVVNGQFFRLESEFEFMSDTHSKGKAYFGGETEISVSSSIPAAFSETYNKSV